MDRAALHIGPVALIHRFGFSLNGHVNFHLSVVGGVFEEMALCSATALPWSGHWWSTGYAPESTYEGTVRLSSDSPKEPTTGENSAAAYHFLVAFWKIKRSAPKLTGTGCMK